jgi:uncharacterized protein (UPF0261 family)
MKKTIAIIACANTKMAEMELMRDMIERGGFEALTIDASSRGGYTYAAGVSASEVARAGGSTIEAVWSTTSRAEAISAMEAGVTNIVSSLYCKGRLHGAIGLGGLQNSTMASSALRLLPIGIPKFILSTVACGNRPFELLVGEKDIAVMPSVADIAGINPVTETVLRNAAAAVMGMVLFAGEKLSPKGPLIAATMMGATNDGIVNAVKLLEAEGRSVVTFHSTGVGGRCMESLILDGTISAVLDLCPHEIISQDVFGGGFSVGAKNRLCAAAKMGIPAVVAPGGMDFVDFPAKEFFGGIIGEPGKRKYVLHNKDTAHIKLFPDEAVHGAKIMATRLNAYSGKLSVIFPLRGMRSETRQGEPLYDPEVDQAVFDTLRKELKKDIRRVELDAHLFDAAFSRTAADELRAIL